MAKESGFDSIWFLLRILLLGSAPWVLGFLKRDYEDEYFSPYAGMNRSENRPRKTPISEGNAIFFMVLLHSGMNWSTKVDSKNTLLLGNHPWIRVNQEEKIEAFDTPV